MKIILFKIETLYLKLKNLPRKKPVIWFTSDLHFSHKNVINYCNRPFKDVSEMNPNLISRWNAMVKPQDTIYVLGDFSLNANRARDFGALLKGHKLLVPGNHDDVFWSNRRLNRYTDGGFTVLSKHVYLTLSNKIGKMLLSHMPYNDETSHNYDVRYPEHRPIKGDEALLLHGHQHCKYVKSGNRIDVGIDNNFRLYSLEDIERMFKGSDFIKSRLDGHVSVHAGEAM